MNKGDKVFCKAQVHLEYEGDTYYNYNKTNIVHLPSSESGIRRFMFTVPLNKPCVVLGKTTVPTGNYYAGVRSNSLYYDDYEPATLVTDMRHPVWVLAILDGTKSYLKPIYAREEDIEIRE